MTTLFKIFAVCVIVSMNLMMLSIAIGFIQTGQVFEGALGIVVAVCIFGAMISFWIARFHEIDAYKKENNEMNYLNRHHQ